MSEFYIIAIFFSGVWGNNLHAIMIQQDDEFWSLRSAAGPGVGLVLGPMSTRNSAVYACRSDLATFFGCSLQP